MKKEIMLICCIFGINRLQSAGNGETLQLIPMEYDNSRSFKKSRCEWPFKWKYSPENDSENCQGCRGTLCICGAGCCILSYPEDFWSAVGYCFELAEKNNNAPITCWQTIDGFFGCTECTPLHIANNIMTAIGCCAIGIAGSPCITDQAWKDGKWCNSCVRKNSEQEEN